MSQRIIIFCLTILIAANTLAQLQKSNFSYLDVFELEYASDPQIAPDGEWVSIGVWRLTS